MSLPSASKGTYRGRRKNVEPRHPRCDRREAPSKSAVGSATEAELSKATTKKDSESMSQRVTENAIRDLVETLADIEHERWSHWQRYMHGKCEKQGDGSLRIPRELALRWERQSKTPYSELGESERESDREQVRLYLPVILKAFDVETETGGAAE